MWLKKWKKEETKYPTTAIETLKTCDSDIYPNIHLALSFICVLPVSVASSERAFSTLKRLKTWLRSTMRQERLVALALMHVHQDLDIDLESILTRFSKMKKRVLIL